jgi:hypothetical protein
VGDLLQSQAELSSLADRPIFSPIQTFSGHRKPIAGAQRPTLPTGALPMPRFFFHVLDGGIWSRDDEGDEFPDVAAAIQEAAPIARELLEDRELLEEEERPNDADFRMEVADEHGNVVHGIRSQDVTNH